MVDLCSCLFIFLVVASLELIQPFYFIQDDNYSQFIPIIVAAYDSLLNSAAFPLWNPYQLLGQPVFDVGVYALSYPFNFLSYCIARFLLLNEIYMLHVYYVIHALMGYFFMSAFLRRQGCDPVISATASLTFIFCGYNLLVCRSWFYMIPIIAWLPFLFLMGDRLVKRTRLSDVLLTGVGLGLFFHAGNAQLWLYCSVMFGIFLLLKDLHSRSLEQLTNGWLIFLIALLVAAPVLVPQFLFTTETVRTIHEGGISRGLQSLFIPPSIVNSSLPPPHENDHSLTGVFYYSGTVYLVLGIAGVVRSVTAKKTGFTVTILVVLSCILFDFSLGDRGYTWWITSQLPLFDKFSRPYKALQLFQFCIIGLGALVVSGLLQNTSSYRKTALVTFNVICLALVLYTVSISQTSFFDFPSRDWRISDERLAFLPGSQQRVLTSTHRYLDDPNFVNTLNGNLATTNKIYSFYGYSPLVEYTPIYRQVAYESAIQGTFPEWGVSTLLQYDESSKTVDVLGLNGVKSLVHSSKGALNWSSDWQGIDIEVPKMVDDTITVNFLAWPNMRLLPGLRKDFALVAHDSGRINLMPLGEWPGGTIRIEYEYNWRPVGIVWCLVSVLLAGTLFLRPRVKVLN
jgi:hypothetical protein